MTLKCVVQAKRGSLCSNACVSATVGRYPDAMVRAGYIGEMDGPCRPVPPKAYEDLQDTPRWRMSSKVRPRNTKITKAFNKID